MRSSAPGNPYDEVSYPSYPIEWTSPERLALAARVHGGPRAKVHGYRMLELGCGNGANLLPLAFYREHSEFVGVDGAATPIAIANQRCTRLGLRNLTFLQATFEQGLAQLSGTFDYIVAHGVFSWVSDEARDAVLKVCAERLAPDGLLCVSYNAQPGWTIRGLVRGYFNSQAAPGATLEQRAAQAQELATKMAGIFELSDHPYSRLMAREMKFVADSDPFYVAHDFLSENNRAYWRSEFMAILDAHGFSFVGDADFNYPSGQIPEGAMSHLQVEQVALRVPGDVLDFVLYRQLHCPILARKEAPLVRLAPVELGDMFLASSLRPKDETEGVFIHPASGFEVHAQPGPMRDALRRLLGIWPRGMRVADLMGDVSPFQEDLLLLYRNGLIDLRVVEPTRQGLDHALASLERELGYQTTAYHTREATSPPDRAP